MEQRPGLELRTDDELQQQSGAKCEAAKPGQWLQQPPTAVVAVTTSAAGLPAYAAEASGSAIETEHIRTIIHAQFQHDGAVLHAHATSSREGGTPTKGQAHHPPREDGRRK